MKLEFDRDQLSKALQKIGSVVEKKSTMPILGNVFLEARDKTIRLIATDLETTIQSECMAKVTEEGTLCVPARSLIDIVKELPERTGRMKKTENEWVSVESGKACFKVVGTPAEKFPKALEASQFKFMKVRKDTLKNAFDKTTFAISTDEMRYNLNGAYTETAKDSKGRSVFRVVTTDGHRLALYDHAMSDDEEVSFKKGVIFPRKAVAEIRKLLSEAEDAFAQIALTDTHAAIKLEDTTIYMRLIVGEFPDYKTVIPKTNKRKLVVNRNLFTSSLRRVSLLSEGKTKCVKLSLKGSGVHLAANTPELGEAEEEVQAEFEGAELEIGFNARYLLDVLTVSSGDRVVLELDQETSPGLIKNPDDPGFSSVIMPMRI